MLECGERPGTRCLEFTLWLNTYDDDCNDEKMLQLLLIFQFLLLYLDYAIVNYYLTLWFLLFALWTVVFVFLLFIFLYVCTTT